MPVWRLEILLVGEFTNTETAGLRPDCVCTDKGRAAEASLGMDSASGRGEQSTVRVNTPAPSCTPWCGALSPSAECSRSQRGKRHLSLIRSVLIFFLLIKYIAYAIEINFLEVN